MQQNPESEAQSTPQPTASSCEAPSPEANSQELEKLVLRLENCGLLDYLKTSRNIPKVFWLNFMSGIARGLGFTVGTAMVLALAYKIISSVISMNIPYLTEMLTDLIGFIKDVQ